MGCGPTLQFCRLSSLLKPLRQQNAHGRSVSGYWLCRHRIWQRNYRPCRKMEALDGTTKTYCLEKAFQLFRYRYYGVSRAGRRCCLRHIDKRSSHRRGNERQREGRPRFKTEGVKQVGRNDRLVACQASMKASIHEKRQDEHLTGGRKGSNASFIGSNSS